MPEPTVAIEVSNVSKSYGGTRAVDRINFQVPRGQILGFLGPNGAGKTTTMKILTCFIAPSDGTARVNGHDVFTNPVEVRQSVGYLPESNPLYTEMTALEYLEFSAEMRGVGGDTGKLKKVVDATGLGDVLGKEIRAMSKGYRQRVGLAGAMVHEPPILILDEPMSGLDPLGRALVRDLILEERARGATVCFSSHILSDVQALSDRVAIIVRGRLRGVGTVASLIGDRVRYVELVVEGEVDVGGELVRRDGAVRTLRLAPDRVDEAVRAVVQAGGRVLELQPVRDDLEAVLLGEVERAGPVDETRLGVL